jgi:ketosteroid isomerase-like protein
VSREQVEIVRRCWEGLEQDPPNLHLEHFAPDVEIWNPRAWPLQGPFLGHKGIKQWAREVWEVYTDLHNEIEEIIEAGDGKTIVSIQRTQARMRHTEIPVDNPWAVVWTFEDGKVVRAEGFIKAKEALEVAGLSE